MNIGKLRHPVVIESPNKIADNYGEEKYQEPWKPFAKAMARVSPLSGRELWNAQQVQPDVTHRVEMRYMSGITPGMRVNFNGRKLNILSTINIDERNTELHLVCMEMIAT